jgi:predicted Rossmann-fold nucleotide-binding protein
MKGTGVGAMTVVAVGAHAASIIVTGTAVRSRRTRWRYAELECLATIGDWI